MQHRLHIQRMIDVEAADVVSCGVCKARCKLREAVGPRRAIRNRKQVQEWLHASSGSGTRRDRRHVGNAYHRLAQTHPFIPREEERLVSLDWPTKRGAERIQALRRLC